MGYVWTPEQIDRYRKYYDDIRTHHTYTYVRFRQQSALCEASCPRAWHLPMNP